MLHICNIWRLFLNWKKIHFTFFWLNNLFSSVYLLFHNIYQNYYFSGRIKQKHFSEVKQLQVIQYYSNTVTSNTVHLLCHNIFQNHIIVTIKFYNNSFVAYQNSTFLGLTRNELIFIFFHNSKICELNKINNYLTLEINMLNVQVDLLKYALKWAAENI